jgi:hypothetical protein
MTHANVGSLLVFDPAKIKAHPAHDSKLPSAARDAVVGIFTERGERRCGG